MPEGMREAMPEGMRERLCTSRSNMSRTTGQLHMPMLAMVGEEWPTRLTRPVAILMIGWMDTDPTGSTPKPLITSWKVRSVEVCGERGLGFFLVSRNTTPDLGSFIHFYYRAEGGTVVMVWGRDINGRWNSGQAYVDTEGLGSFLASKCRLPFIVWELYGEEENRIPKKQKRHLLNVGLFFHFPFLLFLIYVNSSFCLTLSRPNYVYLHRRDGPHSNQIMAISSLKFFGDSFSFSLLNPGPTTHTRTHLRGRGALPHDIQSNDKIAHLSHTHIHDKRTNTKHCTNKSSILSREDLLEKTVEVL